MPGYRRHFEPGQLQFITTSAHSRTKLVGRSGFRPHFVEGLGQPRPNHVGARLVRALGGASPVGQVGTRLNRAKAPAASGRKNDS
jgi:hypothetical protein